MARVGQRFLVFGIGQVCFLLDFSWVVEVLGPVGELLDFNHSDLSNNIVAAIEFRKTLIPVLDPAVILGVGAFKKIREKSVLIVRGSEGNWALAVDSVDELTDHETLLPCTVPDLLKPFIRGFYSDLRLIDGRPYVLFDPENFYGVAQVMA